MIESIDVLTIAEARAAVERGKEIEKVLGMQTAAIAPLSNAIPLLQIAILNRGFVYVGNVSIEGDWLTITDALNVRYYGTKKGLGELAKSGPLQGTILDFSGTIRAPLRALVALIECEVMAWKK